MPLPEQDDHKTLRFVCEPGGISIEAAADVAAGESGKTKLPRFSMVAYTGGAMRIAGWRYPVIVDLAGLTIPSQSRPIRFGHDATAGVGHTDSIAVAEGAALMRSMRRCSPACTGACQARRRFNAGLAPYRLLSASSMRPTKKSIAS